MNTIETIKVVTIHLIVPLMGLFIYLILISKIKREKVNDPPIIDLFLIFAIYGGLLLVILTTIFWKWSGMASLGTFFLILGAPIVMGIIAYRNYLDKLISKYHLWTYRLGLYYFIIAPLTLLVLIVFD